LITQLPETVQSAWGEPAVRDFTAWLEGVMADGAVGRDEFGRMDTRLTIVEHDVADIKINQREMRREMNERFERISAQMDERFDQLGERMTTQMRWSMSVLVVVATLVTVLVGLGQMMP